MLYQNRDCLKNNDLLQCNKTMLGRAAEPQEIIDLCLFVASEKGQFINDENSMIDGGRNTMERT